MSFNVEDVSVEIDLSDIPSKVQENSYLMGLLDGDKFNGDVSERALNMTERGPGYADKKLDKAELDRLLRNRERINEFHRYFGMPAIIFNDDLVRFRHPYRERHFPPFNTKKYDKKYKINGGTEIIKVRGNNYDYRYNNKRTGVEEKIEIKNKKYEYYYRDRNMMEKLEVHHANNKYSYYYKNFNNGRTIKKEGRGRKANKYSVYEELKEKYRDLEDDDYYEDEYEDDDNDEDDDNGIDVKFDIKIDLSDLFN